MNRRSSWRYYAKYVVSCVLVVLIASLALWVLFGVGSLFGPDTGDWKNDVHIDWDYGAIVVDPEDNTAEYSSSFKSLYTKDLIECTGYELRVSFPAGVNLEVHYFDAEDNYLGTKKLEDIERIVHYESGAEAIPEGTAGIRLCLTPESGTSFKFPALDIGNIFMKAKYADYVELDITADAVGVDNINGV